MKKKTLKIIGNTILWVIIGLIFTVLLCNSIDKASGYNFPFFGYRMSVIVSESMSRVHEDNLDTSKDYYVSEDMQQYQVNDVIYTKTYDKFEDIKKYDVVSYLSEKGLITHRVKDTYTSEDGRHFIVCRGDANNIDDTPIEFSLIRGKVINSTKGGGVLLFFNSPYFFLCICGVGFFATLGYYIYNYTSIKEKAAAKKEASINKKEEDKKE